MKRSEFIPLVRITKHILKIFLDTVVRPSAFLDTVPRPSAMTSLDKVPWSSACLDSVTQPSACLDTVPRLSAMTSLGKVPLGLVHA